MNIELFTDTVIIQCFLVFCRTAAIIALMPGASWVPMRIKVVFTVMFVMLISPNVYIPHNILFVSVILEVFIGFFLGTIINVLFNSLHIAGTMIAAQIGLVYSSLSDSDSESGIIAFFMLIVTLVLFTSQGYVLILSEIAHSYERIRIYQDIELKGLVEVIIDVVANSFMIAFKIAVPMVIFGSLIYFCSGIVSRLIPAIQAFFIVAPVQIWVGFILIMMTITSSVFYLVDFTVSYVANIYN